MSFLSNLLRFKGEVKNEISMLSQNGLHKLPIVIFGLAQKAFELKPQKWPGDDSPKKKSF